MDYRYTIRFPSQNNGLPSSALANKSFPVHYIGFDANDVRRYAATRHGESVGGVQCQDSGDPTSALPPKKVGVPTYVLFKRPNKLN